MRKASLAQGEGRARARKTKGRFHHKETSVRPDVGGGVRMESSWERKTVKDEEFYLVPVACQEHRTSHFTQTLQPS